MSVLNYVPNPTAVSTGLNIYNLANTNVTNSWETGMSGWLSDATTTTAAKATATADGIILKRSVRFDETTMPLGDATVSIDIRSSRACNIQLQCWFMDTAFATVGTQYYSTLIPFAAGETKTMTGPVTKLNGATKLLINVTASTGIVTNDSIWITNLSLTQGTKAVYFSGVTPASANYSYAWTGAAHGSSSRRTLLVANTPPVSSFTTSQVALDVTATSTATDSDGIIASTSTVWDWGDGTATTAGISSSHSYAIAGTYTITQTVTDDEGAATSSTKAVTVSAPASLSLTANRTTIAAGDIAYITATSNAVPTSYTWRVDGTVQPVSGPVFALRNAPNAAASTANVSLTINSANGAATSSVTITKQRALLYVNGGTVPSYRVPYRNPRLKYAPPAQTNPTVITLSTGYYQNTFGPSEDVILNFPSTPRTSNLNISGGRHIRVIGGAGAGLGATIRFRDVRGSVFLQGLQLDLNGTSSDAINAHGVGTAGNETYPDIYLQDIRVTGLTGSFAGTHADLYQPQGNVGNLYVDRVTGFSDYQGFFIRPEWPLTHAYLNRVDMHDTAAGSGYLYWFTNTDGSGMYPVTLSECYAMVANGRSVVDSIVWPKAGLTLGDGTPYGAIANANGDASWPAAAKVTGSIKKGLPVTGEFVPAGKAGVGYINPGYIS